MGVWGGEMEVRPFQDRPLVLEHVVDLVQVPDLEQAPRRALGHRLLDDLRGLLGRVELDRLARLRRQSVMRKWLRT